MLFGKMGLLYIIARKKELGVVRVRDMFVNFLHEDYLSYTSYLIHGHKGLWLR